MSITTQDLPSGEGDVSNIAPEPDTKLSKAAEALIMTVALQKREWQDLRSTSGVVLRLDNFRDPSSGRSYLLVAFGTDTDDLIGNDATGEITLNGVSIDDLLVKIIESKEAPEEKEDKPNE